MKINKRKLYKTLKQIGHSFLINAGVIMTLFVMIIMIKGWSDLLSIVNNLPEGYQEIGLIGVLGFLLLSIRLPRVIGDEFEYQNR